MSEDQTVELSQVSRAIRRYWALSVLAFVCIFGAAAYFAYSPPAQYSATATLLVEPADTSLPNSVTNVTFFLPALQIQLQSNHLAADAASRMPNALRGATVNMSNSVQAGTGILQVTAESKNAHAVAPWANAYAKALIAEHPLKNAVQLKQLETAATPSGPNGTNRLTLLISGFVLALIVAAVLPLIADMFLRRRRLEAEIGRRFGLPVLGAIPPAGRRARVTDAAGLVGAGDSAFVDAVLAARASLESRMPGGGSTQAFASPDHREGTTTVVGMLAWALARVGHDVFVLDANLRYPSAAAETPPRRGAVAPTGSGALARAASDVRLRMMGPEDLRRAAEQAFPGSVRNLHSAETLAIALPHSLRSVERSGGVTLIDAPPLTEFADTAVVLGVASGVVIVVDARRRGALRRLERAVTRVRDGGGTITGVVVNRSRRKRGAAVSARAAGPVSPALAPSPLTGNRQHQRPAHRDDHARQSESPTEVV